MIRWLALAALIAEALRIAPTPAARAQAPQSHAEGVRAARRLGLPERFGDWRFVRYVDGNHAHFLYAQGKRSFSLFVTDTGQAGALSAREGWKPVVLPDGATAYLHHDPRDPSRAAIAWKKERQRRILVSRLGDRDLLALAQRLR